MTLLTFFREHLYRRHALPIQCRRCFEAFKTEDLLDQHHQLPDPCQRQPPPDSEGFDKAQEKRLKNRKRKPGVETEEEKWREVYKILFPADDVAAMPSPCGFSVVLTRDMTDEIRLRMPDCQWQRW